MHNIHFPNKILMDITLNNRSKNLAILLYQYKNNNYETRLTDDEVTKYIDIPIRQHVVRYAGKLKDKAYIDIIREKEKRGRSKKYILNITPKTDFTMIPSDIYKKYRNNSDIIINYAKLKHVNLVVTQNGKKQADIEDYISYGSWKEKEFIEVTKMLQDEGLIKRNFSIEFLKENIYSGGDSNSYDNAIDLSITEQKPSIKLVDNQLINAQEAIQYFYDKVGGMCSNWPKETAIIKRLEKKGYDLEHIKTGMAYISKIQGLTSLSLLEKYIDEAHEFKKYKKQLKVQGTIPYLVQQYHDRLGLRIVDKLLTQQIKKAQSLIDAGYKYEDIEKTIAYMIKKKSPFNFITTEINAALIAKQNTVTNNPCFNQTQGREAVILRDVLEHGYRTIKDLYISSNNNPQKVQLIDKIARQIYDELSNNPKRDVWAKKVGFIVGEQI